MAKKSQEKMHNIISYQRNAIKATIRHQVTQQRWQNGIKINPKESRKKRKWTTDGTNLKQMTKW